jgi:uncharacterized protein
MALVQMPTLWHVDLLDKQRFLISLLACVPLFLGMPVGAWLARHIEPVLFDRIIMLMLFVIALRLILSAI